ncbi:hypothetical protein [Klebsiella phage vB_KpnS_IME279]|uniref:Uncharacterized protein n=1 Tax=Klebsiella phage vB_KpnS_IME279 TaxID=2041211 RepID=A0A291LBE8_9CAUD|nr:hypothetical protein HOS15_gp58 [Klebsiella phage vB_KpnS_IME279]ATI16452.1 hypothetical protein [Klebsiella phage vB_KpnS_IME279]
MNKLTLARPVRHLDEEPLEDAELMDLAGGANPRHLVTMAMCDTEEIVIHLSKRLLDALEELADLTAERDQLRQELRDEVGR